MLFLYSAHMTYTINGIINYKPEDGTLWNINEPERVISLTLTNSNLLQFILDSKGAVLSREAVLENIWEKQGLRSSNNTLNQYISISRRTLSLLGAEEVIVTIPRIGFCLSKTVKVVREVDKGKSCSVSPAAVNRFTETSSSGKKRGLLTLLFFLVLIFIYFLHQHSQFSVTSGLFMFEPELGQQKNVSLRKPPGEQTPVAVCKEYYPQ